jgi:peptidyl-prolyl cis-trans isomerase D
VKDKIEPFLKQQMVSSALNQAATSAETEARTQGIEKAAAKYNAQVVESNPVSRTDALPGIGASPELMTSIFSVNEKAGATAARASQGYVIFQVEKIIPPRTPAFEEIKDRVAGDFKAERSNGLLSQKTQELADRAHTEHDLKKAAKELGATVKTSDLVTHSSQVPDIGAMSGAASAAFGLQQGQISGPLNLGRSGAVLQVLERQEPGLGDEFAKSKDTVREQLIGQKRQEAMQLFMQNLDGRLKKEGKLKENKDVVSSLTKMRG